MACHQMARNDTFSSHLLHTSRRPEPKVVDDGAVSENVLPCQIFLTQFAPSRIRDASAVFVLTIIDSPKFPCGGSLLHWPTQSLILARAPDQVLSDFLNAISFPCARTHPPPFRWPLHPQAPPKAGRAVRQQAVDRPPDFLNAISVASVGAFGGFMDPVVTATGSVASEET